MAIEYVGSNQSNSAGAITLSYPAGIAADDVALLYVESMDQSVAAPTGFTQLSSSPQSVTGHRLTAFYRVITGSESDISIADSGDHTATSISVFRGCDTSAPIHATAGFSPGAAGSAITCPAVTTTVDVCAIVNIVGTSRDAAFVDLAFSAWTNANLFSITEIQDRTMSGGAGGGYGLAWGILVSAGSSGETTATHAVNDWWTAITVALAPASTGGSAAELDGDATATATASGALTTQIPLSAAAAIIATATGALSTQIALSGAAATVSSAAGSLTASITLTAAALSQALAAAGLTTSIQLAGAAAGAAQASGELASGAAQLAGAAAVSASGIASLTTQIALSGTALAAALAAGDLSATPAGLAGSATAGASATGALLTQIPLMAAAEASTTAAGGLSTSIQLAGAAASISSATGALLIESTLSGTALAQVLAGGDLTTLIQLDAAAVARAAASGSLGGGSGTPAILRHLVEAASANWTVEARPGPWEVYA